MTTIELKELRRRVASTNEMLSAAQHELNHLAKLVEKLTCHDNADTPTSSDIGTRRDIASLNQMFKQSPNEGRFTFGQRVTITGGTVNLVGYKMKERRLGVICTIVGTTRVYVNLLPDSAAPTKANIIKKHHHSVQLTAPVI